MSLDVALNEALAEPLVGQFIDSGEPAAERSVPFSATRGLRMAAFAATVAGLAVRPFQLLVEPGKPLANCDGRAYYDIGVALTRGRMFYIDDPQLSTICHGFVSQGPSHHYAPGLPLIYALTVGIFGDNLLALVLPLIALSWLAVIVAWGTTRNIFGADAAIVVAAMVSLDWTGAYFGTWFGYSENLVMICITVTLWALIRALRDDRFIAIGGIAAAAGYLSKASIGWFFLIAGAGGLLYRVMFRGIGIVQNRWYWTGALIFAVPFILWSYRNVSVFWDGSFAGLTDAWQTSSLHSAMIADAVARPELLAAGFVAKVPVLFVGLALPLLPLWRPIGQSLRDWRHEEVFGLWMAVALIFVLGCFFAAVFWIYQPSSLLWADPIRYVMPAELALLWLVVRRTNVSTTRWVIAFLISYMLCVVPPAVVFTR